MKKEILKKMRCEECNSAYTYTRLSRMERVCRKCGHITKIKIEVIK